MKFILLFLIIFFLNASQAQIITTVAGNGTYGYTGNGGLATSAQLAWQTCVITDNSGNIFIADTDNNVVRKVNTAGIITNFAGNGIAGYTGDGGLSSIAQLYHPLWMGIDNLNNIYIIDQNGEVIRKVDNNTGQITSITGNLPQGYSGDGGPLLGAQFRSISGVSFDNAGNMYIADHGNKVIRKVNSSGIISTVAGTGTSGFSGDGGPAVSAQLGSPFAVVFDSKGNMYFPDPGRIRKISPAGIITTFAGTGNYGYSGDGGQAVSADLGIPWTIDLDNADNLYIGDAGANVVRKVEPNGIITTYAGNGIYGNTGDGGKATMAELGTIAGVHVDISNNLLISVREYFNVIRKVNNCLTASISQQPINVTLCNSGSALFSITASNATSFQWEENTGTGWNTLTNNTTYNGTTGNSLNISNAGKQMNGFQYRCKATNSCAGIYSTPATLNVTAPSMPSLNITTANNTICTGSNVIFTASSIHGGTNPIFQWLKNGINIGTNTSTYSDNGLIDGDNISCVLTSNSNCISTTTAASNTITISVIPFLTPSITIIQSLNNICFGTPVTFNSISLNGGLTPVYQWKKNGVSVGGNLSNYTDNNLNNGDIITCSLTSNQNCITASTVNSNAIVMSVTPLATPSVTISSSNQSICSGKAVTFFAVAVNAGTPAVYQWKKNGVNVGSNTNSFTNSNFLNGDVITCIITSTNNCLTMNSASSNSIPLTISQNPVVVLDKTQTICTGSFRTLDAGNFKSYLWNDGSNNRTLKINSIGLYYVTVTDMNNCAGSDTTKITTQMQSPKNFLPADTSVCSYGSITINSKQAFSKYLWSNYSMQPSLTVYQDGLYWLEVKDNNNCVGKDTIAVLPKDCLQGFYIPSAFSPNNDGNNDFFKPFLFGNVKKYKFLIFNRWGQTVFQTTDFNKGWDGNFKDIKQNGNVFVWTCQYQFENENEEYKKGTVIMIR